MIVDLFTFGPNICTLTDYAAAQVLITLSKSRYLQIDRIACTKSDF